jgi:RNA 2',3'-cyclic 3'-phosphodiesterase
VRTFIAVDIKAVWPQTFPSARLIDENERHLTLLFLGDKEPKPLPLPSFTIGSCGYANAWIFLPHVVAMNWMPPPLLLEAYQKELAKYFEIEEKRPFFPHISLARGAFSVEEWQKVPCQIPFYATALSLKESLGYSKYKTLWSHPFTPPFEEMEHTADIAFLVRGANFSDLALHGQVALAFHFPPLIPYLMPCDTSTLDGVVAHLNRIIAQADAEIGVPFKAVSYHAELQHKNNILEWRMIVDV